MYIIHKTATPVADMHAPEWEKAELAEVATLNWPELYDFNPGMQARILYSDFGLHVKFTTQEKPLLARATEQNGAIYKDSCMEFFFKPKAEDPRYINFEINPFATMYLAIRTGRKDAAFPAEDKKYFGIVSEVEDGAWSLMFTVPFEFIDRNFGGIDKTFYGNIYKCGNETVHKHYVTYYPMNINPPDFHRPDCFGPFVLEA